jgi:hypothetical protein
VVAAAIAGEFLPAMSPSCNETDHAGYTQTMIGLLSDRVLTLLGVGWFGLTIGLIDGKWDHGTIIGAVIYGVLTLVFTWRGWEPPPDDEVAEPVTPRRRALGRAVTTVGTLAVVVIAAFSGAPPGWVVAGALVPLALAARGLSELRRPAPRSASS